MRIVIADNNELIKIGLRTIITNRLNAQIIGEASSQKELIDLISNFDTDIVLIDFTALGFEIQTIRRIKSINKKIKIVAITPPQNSETIASSLKIGIESYVKKDCDLTEIIDALKETYDGNQFFCGEILKTIQKANIDIENLNLEELTCEAVILSIREKEIIQLIAQGLTNAEISEKLFISKHTVNTHRKNIMHKIGVKNTAGIVIYAVKTNLISPNKFLFANQIS